LPANWVSFEGKGRFFRLPGEVRAIFGSELSVHRHLSLCDIGLRTGAHEKFREYRIICDFYSYFADIVALTPVGPAGRGRGRVRAQANSGLDRGR
jgi:hypothetical protein